jgi:hypothetical protein
MEDLLALIANVCAALNPVRTVAQPSPQTDRLDKTGLQPNLD